MSESGDLARQVSVMCDMSESSQTSYMTYTRNILDCDQSNVLLARIIFLLYSFNCFLVPFFSHRKWRHRSCDHSTPGSRLSIGGP